MISTELMLDPLWISATLLVAFVIGMLFENRRTHRSADRNPTIDLHQLRKDEERYRLLSELSSDLDFEYRFDADGELTEAWTSPTFTALTGYAPDEARDLGWRSLIHPDDHELALRGIRTAREEGTQAVRLRARTRSGETRWLEGQVSGRVTPDTGESCVMGVLRDITESLRDQDERGRFEQHVQEVQRLESLGVLAGRIAHDFNNLLGVVLGHSSLALADVPADSGLAKRLSRVRTAAQHGVALTDQMLSYSGGVALTMKQQDLTRLIEGVRDLLEASVPSNAQLDIEIADGVPMIEADETQIHQILVNLVTNAADALGGKPGRITIRVRCARVPTGQLQDAYGVTDLAAGEFVLLEVSDTGCGIRDECRSRIFEPFYTTKSTGRGLGMAAVLGIVKSHGGAITVASQSGRGTTFRVHLPPRREAYPPPPLTSNPERAGSNLLS